MASIIEKLMQKFRRQQDDAPRTSIAESFQQASQNQSVAPIRKSTVQKPALEKYYPYLFALVVGFFIADITTLIIRSYMITDTAPSAQKQVEAERITKLRSEYNIITERNIFNSDGIIPPAISSSQPTDKDDGPATLSDLPLNLIGTIVHANPGKSVAAIQGQSSKVVIPYLPNDEIEGMARLIKVERKKAIFRNLKNSKLEYIEIPEDGNITFNVGSQPTSGAGGSGQTNFSLKRSDINKHLKNLPTLLQQARAVPNIIPGSGGEVDGFRILDVAQDSIFTQIGIKPGDVIKGVNGEDVNSPAKAMEMYNTLKNENKIEVTITRDGREETLSYTIE